MFLPKEIWGHIFEYDKTYHDIYAICLYDIHTNKIVKSATRIKRMTNLSAINVVEIYVFLGIDKNKNNNGFLHKKMLLNLYLFMRYHDFVELYNWWGKWKKVGLCL